MQVKPANTPKKSPEAWARFRSKTDSGSRARRAWMIYTPARRVIPATKDEG